MVRREHEQLGGATTPEWFDQRDHQVRFDWGQDGLARLARADIVVVVDVLRFTTRVTDLVAGGEVLVVADALGWSINGAAVALRAEAESTVLAGSLRNPAAVAKAVLDQRSQLGDATIAIIAAGEREGRSSGATVRFAIEDLLGAGAVIAALAEVGIVDASPEALVASGAFREARSHIAEILSASGSGREVIERGLGDTEWVRRAAEIDAVDAVGVLRDGVFVRWSSRATA